MAPADQEIVGRDEELSALARFLDEDSSPPAALLLQGAAGMGKTTLWAHAVARAASPPRRVLTACGGSAETRLAFAGLSDLLEPLLGELGALPAPQRRALEVALLLTDPEGPPPDQRAIGAAVLSLLKQAAADEPVLVALDDAHWLDPASVAVLAFVVRRLGSEPVRLLVAQRTDDPAAAAPLDLERALPGRLQRVRLKPLSLGALHRLLSSRLGLALPRPTLHRVASASGGNPFFALQIGAVLREQPGPVDPTAPLPIPADIHELLRRRLATVSPDGREALLAGAALVDPLISLVEEASSSNGVEEAVAAGVATFEGDRLRFTHPLLAEAAYSHAAPGRRRSMHRRLAGLLGESPERVWHLALGADGQDEEVALALDESAAQARARGAPTIAARLHQEAARLTPPHAAEEAARRTIAAANMWIDAGVHHHAAALIEPLVASLPPGGQRSDAIATLARTVASRSEFDELQERAVAEAGDDAGRRASLLINICYARLHANELDAARNVAHDAMVAADRADNDRLRVLTTSMAGRLACWMGLGHGAELLRESLRIESASGPVDAYEGPGTWLGWWLLAGDDLAEARPLLEEQYRRSSEVGDDYSRLWLCWPMTELECRSGDYVAARQYAELGYELAEQLQNQYVFSPLLFARALVAAHTGDSVAARRLAEASRIAAEQVDSQLFATRPLIALGIMAVAEGAPAEARAHLDRLYELHATTGRSPDSGFSYWPDVVEALVATGELTRAAEITDERERHARSLGRVGKLALAARCRALIAAAGGDLGGAAIHLDDALRWHDERPVPLELGRTLLVRGQILRRGKQKRSARESLQEALVIFERLSAPHWAARARGELSRIGGRTASPVELTASEHKVALLVAEGKTNREVAAELFIATRTVEAALTRIYGKLSVRSRTELANRVGGLGDAPVRKL